MLENLTCYKCNNKFTAENSKKDCICPACNEIISVSRAIKYDKNISAIKSEENKILANEYYQRVDALLNEGDFYLKQNDFNSAEKCFSEGLKITSTDSRLLFGMVKVKTHNFTDLKDTSHFTYFKKAIDFASFEQKKSMRAEYSYYYGQRGLTDEELASFKKTDCINKKNKAEKLLKDAIPRHYKMKKSLLYKIITSIALYAISVILIPLLFVFNSYNSVDFIICAILILCVFVASAFILSYINDRSKVNIFDAVLDLYDAIDGFNITPEYQTVIYKNMIKIAVSALNKDSATTIEKEFKKLSQALVNLGDETVNEFMTKYKVFIKATNS